MTDGAVLAVLTAAVLAGAVTMRTTGMGFALLAAPFLVLALGPFEGILVANVCGTASALLNLTQVHGDVDWHRARWVVPAGVVGVVPGAVAVRLLPPAVLTVVVSLVVLVGLAFTVLARRLRVPNSPAAATGGGLASGFMNVTAGVGGPGLVVYALATRWPHTRFAATAQVHFAVLGVASIAMKGALPDLPLLGWGLLAAALTVGLGGGNVLARHVSAAVAMRAVVVIAAVGSLLALASGLAGL